MFYAGIRKSSYFPQEFVPHSNLWWNKPLGIGGRIWEDLFLFKLEGIWKKQTFAINTQKHPGVLFGVPMMNKRDFEWQRKLPILPNVKSQHFLGLWVGDHAYARWQTASQTIIHMLKLIKAIEETYVSASKYWLY